MARTDYFSEHSSRVTGTSEAGMTGAKMTEGVRVRGKEEGTCCRRLNVTHSDQSQPPEQQCCRAQTREAFRAHYRVETRTLHDTVNPGLPAARAERWGYKECMDGRDQHTSTGGTGIRNGCNHSQTREQTRRRIEFANCMSNTTGLHS